MDKTIHLRKRSRMGVLLKLPQVFAVHFKILRSGQNSKMESVRAAYLLTLQLFKTVIKGKV